MDFSYYMYLCMNKCMWACASSSVSCSVCLDLLTSSGDGVILINLVKEKERQTSVWSIELGPKYRKSGTISTKPLLQTNVCLIVLPVVVDCPVNLTLTTTLILYRQNRNSSPSEEFEEPSWVDLSPIILSLVHLVMDHLLTQVKYYVCM